MKLTTAAIAAIVLASSLAQSVQASSQKFAQPSGDEYYGVYIERCAVGTSHCATVPETEEYQGPLYTIKGCSKLVYNEVARDMATEMRSQRNPYQYTYKATCRGDEGSVKAILIDSQVVHDRLSNIL